MIEALRLVAKKYRNALKDMHSENPSRFYFHIGVLGLGVILWYLLLLDITLGTA